MFTSKFEPLGEEGIAKLQQQSDDVFRNKLTKGGRFTENDALGEYTTGMHASVNPYLYGELKESVAIQEMYRKDIKLIDSAMDKWEQKYDITVYRGTKAMYYEDWAVGEVRTVPAFWSTSVTKKEAQRFYDKAVKYGDKPLMIEIHVPKGTRGIYIGDNSDWEDNMEDEFLLGRDSKYKVIERKDDILRLEVIP